jgi:hypothetical protein
MGLSATLGERITVAGGRCESNYPIIRSSDSQAPLVEVHLCREQATRWNREVGLPPVAPAANQCISDRTTATELAAGWVDSRGVRRTGGQAT